MLKPQIHVCLVFNTAVANVTPALDPAFRPHQVILVHSPRHQENAAWLAHVLQPVGIKVQLWEIADDFDLVAVRERLLELLAEYEDQDIALNASGGTRPVSLAAYEIFREFDKPIFYVNPYTDELSWLNRRDESSFNLADKIKMPAFLQAHGVQVTNQGEKHGVPAQLREFIEILVNNATQLAAPLAALNWFAQQANTDLISPRLSEQQQDWPELIALIKAFASHGVLDFRNERLYFANEMGRFFTNGGWLETYVYGVLFGLRSSMPILQDIGRSVEVQRDMQGRPVRNELDVAFIANNHFYIIECKTKRFQHAPNSGDDSPSAETLYKLDTLQNILGGVRASSLLVSYHDISSWDKQRAADLGIVVCSAAQLPRLEGVLREWILRDKL